MKLVKKCDICTKPLEIVFQHEFPSGRVFKVYKCGHVRIETAETKELAFDPSSVDGTKHAFPYQEEGVEFVLGTNLRCLIADQMGLGKAQPYDSTIYTPFGPDKIGHMQIGSIVCTPDGETSKVTSLHPQGPRECYKVTFSDGSSVECDESHLWEVYTPDSKFRGAPNRILETKTLLKQGLTQSNGNSKYYIPITKPVKMEKRELKIDPYILGLLLGDGGLDGYGSKNRVIFSTTEDELLNEMKSHYTVEFIDRCSYNVWSEELCNELRELGLYETKSNSKFIPEKYLYNSKENRLSLLQGILDTDGYVSDSGTIQLTTVSPSLAQGVTLLCDSLGCTSKLSHKSPTYTYKGEKKTGQFAYILTINFPPDTKLFRLQRKVERVQRDKKYFPSRAIKSIEPIGKKDCICIKLEDPKGLYLTENFVVTHNTIQALLSTKARPNLVTLYVVKNSTLWQWVREHKVWETDNPLGIYPIKGPKDFLMPGFKSYIISMDSLRSFIQVKEKKGRKGRGGMEGTHEITEISYRVPKSLKELKISCIVVDEAHSFKDPDSARTKSLITLIEEENIEHRIFLSGTPIKNRADEYFTILNLLDPETFPSFERFKRRWLMQDADSGKWNRINPYVYEQFKNVTSKYIIRREKDEVLTDLPPFQRVFTSIKIEDEQLKKLYNEQLELLRIKREEGGNSFMDIADNLSFLRKITGMGKAQMVAEYVEAFFDETGENEGTHPEKICIGIHHHMVRDLLMAQLSKYKPLQLSGSDSADQKDYVIQKFKEQDRRILIVNMLAGGVGLNLQFCNNALVVERQWSSADEEQFEGRFNRPGQTLPVTADYFIALGTIDEYFYELVERKRKIFGETIANNWDLASNSADLKDLIDWTLDHRL
jgi:hypothetical protein